MKTLYLTDLDGTFLNDNAKVTEKSAEIINRLTKDGLLFSIASARTYATVIPLFKKVDLRIPLVLMNGVCIYDPVLKKTISVHPIEKPAGIEIDKIYRKYKKNPLFYFENNDRLTVCYKKFDNQYIESYVNARESFFNKKFVRVPSFDFEIGNFVYIVTLDRKEELEKIYSELKERTDIDCNFYTDNYTNCYFLEAMCSGINKGTGAAELKKLLGVDKIIAFGDNMNDVPLFKVADESYAVENACDELKKIATGVIGSNDDDAVAKFIQNRFYEERLVP